FIFGIHCQVRIFPIAEDAESSELLALDVDEFSRKRFAFLADLNRRKLARFLYHFVLDWQAMAVPTRDVRSAFAEHRLRFHYKILEDFVERGAHVNVTVCEWRAVMQNEELSALPRFLNLLVKAILLPAPEHFRLARGKVRLHRKLRARQV